MVETFQIMIGVHGVNGVREMAVNAWFIKIHGPFSRYGNKR